MKSVIGVMWFVLDECLQELLITLVLLMRPPPWHVARQGSARLARCYHASTVWPPPQSGLKMSTVQVRIVPALGIGSMAGQCISGNGVLVPFTNPWRSLRRRNARFLQHTCVWLCQGEPLTRWVLVATLFQLVKSPPPL